MLHARANATEVLQKHEQRIAKLRPSRSCRRVLERQRIDRALGYTEVWSLDERGPLNTGTPMRSLGADSLPISQYTVSGVDDEVAEAEGGISYRNTELPCLVCVTTTSLDDDRPRLGTVRWRVAPYYSLKRGTAVGFNCPQGHSSEADPELLRAFPSRTF